MAFARALSVRRTRVQPAGALPDPVDMPNGKKVYQLRGKPEDLDGVMVFNPQGPALPPPQAQLEGAYREHLGRAYGIVFTRLLTLANINGVDLAAAVAPGASRPIRSTAAN